jgi:hypothetical protein
VLPLVAIIAIATIAVLGLAIAVLMLNRQTALRVGPATFAQALTAIATRAQVLELEPGNYSGPWHLGIAQAGVILRATGPGVRLVATGDQPVLRLEPGCKDAQLIGLTIAHPGGVALEVMAGAGVALERTTIAGSVVVAGGSLLCRTVDIDGGLIMDSMGMVTCDGCSVRGPQAVCLRSGSLAMHGCRLVGLAGHEAVVMAQGGDLVLDAVTVHGANATSDGVRLSGGVRAQLIDLQVAEVATGLAVATATVTLIDGLTITASATGIHWTGAYDAAWNWSNMVVQAPIPVAGTVPIRVGTGARPDRLPPPLSSAPAP